MVLETSVGTSRNLRYYDPKKCKKIIGVDYSPNALLKASEKFKGELVVEYMNEDLHKLSFKDNTFDTVVDTFGLEFNVLPHKALQEIERVCKPNGKILILANGISSNTKLAKHLRFKQPASLQNFGRFNRY